MIEDFKNKSIEERFQLLYNPKKYFGFASCSTCFSTPCKSLRYRFRFSSQFTFVPRFHFPAQLCPFVVRHFSLVSMYCKNISISELDQKIRILNSVLKPKERFNLDWNSYVSDHFDVLGRIKYLEYLFDQNIMLVAGMPEGFESNAQLSTWFYGIAFSATQGLGDASVSSSQSNENSDDYTEILQGSTNPAQVQKKQNSDSKPGSSPNQEKKSSQNQPVQPLKNNSGTTNTSDSKSPESPTSNSNESKQTNSQSSGNPNTQTNAQNQSSQNQTKPNSQGANTQPNTSKIQSSNNQSTSPVKDAIQSAGSEANAIQEQCITNYVEIKDKNFVQNSAILCLDENGDLLRSFVTALVYATKNPEKEVVIFGHSTPIENQAFELSCMRAEQVKAFFDNNKEPWLDAVSVFATIRDVQQLLKSFSALRGWRCDPGMINSLLTTKTQEAIIEFKKEFNMQFNASLTEDHHITTELWAAFFKLVHYLMATNYEQESGIGVLPRLNYGYEKQGTYGCGSSFDRSTPAGLQSFQDNRCEIAFFDSQKKPILTRPQNIHAITLKEAQFFDKQCTHAQRLPLCKPFTMISTPIHIRYTHGVKPLTDTVEKIVKSLLQEAKITTILISSTTRTSADQARIMYNNLEVYGVERQKNLYGTFGDQVIDLYAHLKKQQKDKLTIINEMDEKIKAIGPEKVSSHCSNHPNKCSIDIAPSSIPLNQRPVFESVVSKSKSITKFLKPPKDPAYHLEIKV